MATLPHTTIFKAVCGANLSRYAEISSQRNSRISSLRNSRIAISSQRNTRINPKGCVQIIKVIDDQRGEKEFLLTDIIKKEVLSLHNTIYV